MDALVDGLADETDVGEGVDAGGTGDDGDEDPAASTAAGLPLAKLTRVTAEQEQEASHDSPKRLIHRAKLLRAARRNRELPHCNRARFGHGMGLPHRSIRG